MNIPIRSLFLNAFSIDLSLFNPNTIPAIFRAGFVLRETKRPGGERWVHNEASIARFPREYTINS
jgi:hypothetical protein